MSGVRWYSCLVLILAGAIILGTGKLGTGAGFDGVRPLFPIWGHLYAGLFKALADVFVDEPSGEIYVADAGNNMVGIFDREGRWLFSFGQNKELREPRSLVVDREGRILVADLEGVKIFDYRGDLQGFFPFDGLEQSLKYVAMAVGPAGYYFLDKIGRRVLVYGYDWKLRLAFGKKGVGPGQFSRPSDLAVDRAGNIYVVDGRRSAIVQVFNPQGRLAASWGEISPGADGFSLPGGVAVDPSGRVFITDTLRQDIKVFDGTGRFLQRFGGFGRAPGAVAYPTGIASDTKGRIYVAEKVGKRVQVFEQASKEELNRRDTTREDVSSSLRDFIKR